MSALSAPAPAALAVLRGGFWERSLAYVVDEFVLLVPSLIIASIFGDQQLATGLNVLVGIAYFVYFWSQIGGGSTLGMRLFGLRVVKADGSSLDIVGAIIRFVGLIVSFLALGIGVFWVAFDSEKRGWHDMIAGTRVLMLDPQPYPVHVSWEVPASNSRFFAIPLLGLLARIVLLVPHLVVLYFVAIVLAFALLVLWLPVIINGTYPAWGYRLVGGYIRWQARVTAYLYGITDRYPTPYDRNG